MSLNWDLTSIKNYMELCWEPVAEDYKPGYMDQMLEKEDGSLSRMNATTYVIIMTLMCVGRGHIDEKNLDDVALRFELWQDVHGALLRRKAEGKDIEDIRITYEDLHRHIGITTNVGDMAWTKFVKGLRETVERRVKAAARRFNEKAEEPAGAL